MDRLPICLAKPPLRAAATERWLQHRIRSLFAASPQAVQAHVDALTAQLAHLIEDGVSAGEFRSADPASDARAVFDATARFHDPAHAGSWAEPGMDMAFQRVLSLVTAGLAAR